ncbi:MAG: hypothetical protein Q8R76_00550 [Candidatus Omnitrophota bacterium]|nr:hypothetical protein [Candidatus Omnitrophota bacterium]
MPAFYQVKVITPQGVSYTGEASHCLIPGERGFVGVLANHAPYVTSSPGGRFEVSEKDQREAKTFEVGPGFFEVAHNQAIFFTQSFQGGDKPLE